jgi:hypothetical protein
MRAIENIKAAIEARANDLVIEDGDITDLPIELWQLENLTSLEIKNCYNLENLPADISQLINLRSFKITRSKIASFPMELWQLVNLRSLDITVCPRLKTIPAECGQLTNLTALRITGCEELENLPEEIGRLVNLSIIRIFNCENIKLPSGIYKLPNLSFVEIERNCNIYEKHFPQGVPADIQGSILRVINLSHETIALFYGNELLKEANKFSSMEEYCEYYDQLYDDYCEWDNAGINLNDKLPEEQEEDFRKVAQNLRWDSYVLMRSKVKGFNFLLQMLPRLAYPYHCKVKKLERSIHQIGGSIFDYFSDIHVLRKAFELGLFDQRLLMKEIISRDWIFSHPEYWLTKENIDVCLDYALTEKEDKVMNFVLDYKNRNFPTV